MSATSVTLRGRAKAEELMLSTCTITRGATSIVDPDTGMITGTTTTVYTGKCKVQQSAPASSPTVIGEAAVFLSSAQLHLPVSTETEDVAPDDLATINSCLPNPGMVGKTFRLRAPLDKDFLTARRFPVTEVAG